MLKPQYVSWLYFCQFRTPKGGSPVLLRLSQQWRIKDDSFLQYKIWAVVEGSLM